MIIRELGPRFDLTLQKKILHHIVLKCPLCIMCTTLSSCLGPFALFWSAHGPKAAGHTYSEHIQLPEFISSRLEPIAQMSSPSLQKVLLMFSNSNYFHPIIQCGNALNVAIQLRSCKHQVLEVFLVGEFAWRHSFPPLLRSSIFQLDTITAQPIF